MEYFCDVMDEDLIIFNENEMEKKDVLEKLTEHLCHHYGLDTSLILQKILSREEAHSTGIGAGIAIPHCRLPDIDKIRASVLISSTPIEFQALDNKPVHIIFLFVSPLQSAQEHLKFLHFITTFSRSELFDKALKTNSPDDFIDLWKEVCRQEGKV